MKNIGKVTQIIGVVVDVHFDGEITAIYNALELQREGTKERVVLEVQQHIGSHTVRAVAMGATDGIGRGAEVIDTGAPISVPVGPETLGRMFNVVGEVIDEKPEVKQKNYTQFIEKLQVLKANLRKQKYLKLVSKLSTCSVLS